MEPKVKTLDTRYVIKLNNEEVWSAPSYKEAKEYVKKMSIDGEGQTVLITRQNIIEVVIKAYKPQVVKTFTAVELDGRN